MIANPYAAPKAPVDFEARAVAPLAAPNPHVLWRQLCGLILWILALCSFGGPTVIAIGLMLGGVTFADAWISGIYKRTDSKNFLNMTPMSWGIAMVGMFVLAYPVYLASRNRLRTRESTDAFFIATIVIGAAVTILLATNLAAGLLD